MTNSFDPKQQESDITSKLVVGLERLSEVFRVLLWEQSKITGLSPIQIQILIFLKNHDEPLANVSHLSSEFNLKKPTVSDAIKVLFTKGLIKKETGVDARAYTIHLTDDGKRLVKEVQSFAEPLHSHLDELSASDKQSFHKSLTQLIFRLNQAGIIQVQRTCFGCRFYEKNEESHYCNLLERTLEDKDLRLDCQEFEAEMA
ncbi:MarR family winged helix-turn-helix transcriptional regulator [Ekhidna sp.]|uniref:MarR family winged helix-turn-helix transcriptional regulator n=1 Tax=Ekhidna sp. TaxID=2608089 RepID=UPI003C79EB4E